MGKLLVTRTEDPDTHRVLHLIRCPHCIAEVEVSGLQPDAVDPAAEAVIAAHRC